MKEIVWGFIGCGEVTEKKAGPAFNEVEGSRVEAVMSIRLVLMPNATILRSGTPMPNSL